MRVSLSAVVLQFALLISACLSFEAAYRLRCPEMITAVRGDAVTLQYHLDPPINLSAATVEVKRYQDKVHVYRSRGDNPDSQSGLYSNRTALNHTDLMRGVLTLNISSVNQSDSGSYVALVLMGKAPNKLKVYCTTKLIVVDQKRNESSTTSPPTEDGGIKSADPGVVDVKAGSIPAALSFLLWLFLCVGLVTRGMIKNRPQRLRGGREQEEAGTENVPEEIPLSDSSPGGLQLNGRAANGVETPQVI